MAPDQEDPPGEELVDDEAPTLPQYDSAKYWDERYAGDPGAFEWYIDYASLAPLIDGVVARTPAPDAAKWARAVLQLGVGTSDLAAEMIEAGRHGDRGLRIVNIDISLVCVEHMRALHAHLAERGLTYEVGDACDMRPRGQAEGGGGGGGAGGGNGASRYAAPDASFDAVLDKGTADALLCGSGANEQVKALVSEAARVLRPGGAFLLISFGSPDRRLGFLLPDSYTPSERGSEEGSCSSSSSSSSRSNDGGGEGDDDGNNRQLLPWRPRDVQVYVIAKAEDRAEVEAVAGRAPMNQEPKEAEEEGEGGEQDDDEGGDKPPLIFGPLCPTDAPLMERVSALEHVHWAYVCRKPANDAT